MSMVKAALQGTYFSLKIISNGHAPFSEKRCFLEASKSGRLMRWTPACEVSINAVFGSTGAERRGLCRSACV